MDSIYIYLAVRLIRTGESSSLFELHSRFRLTYTQALHSVKYLEMIGLVDFDGKTFCLKRNVSNEQVKELYKKIRYRKLRLDEVALDLYKKSAIEPFSLYFPNLSRLDPTLLIDD